MGVLNIMTNNDFNALDKKKEILELKEDLLKFRLQSTKRKTNLIRKKIARILTVSNNG